MILYGKSCTSTAGVKAKECEARVARNKSIDDGAINS